MTPNRQQHMPFFHDPIPFLYHSITTWMLPSITTYWYCYWGAKCSKGNEIHLNSINYCQFKRRENKIQNYGKKARNNSNSIFYRLCGNKITGNENYTSLGLCLRSVCCYARLPCQSLLSFLATCLPIIPHAWQFSQVERVSENSHFSFPQRIHKQTSLYKQKSLNFHLFLKRTISSSFPSSSSTAFILSLCLVKVPQSDGLSFPYRTWRILIKHAC